MLCLNCQTRLTTIRERNQYFEAMRQIRLKREAIKREFDDEMQRCFGRVPR